MSPTKTKIYIAALVIVLISGSLEYVSAQSAATSTAQTLTREELETQVQAKAQQLNDINSQLDAAKQGLKGTTAERITLQNQLGSIQSNINQLDLSIKSDQISVQKLNLEVQELGYDIQDIKTSITDKKTAIEKLLVELQKNDRVENNFLVIFLRSDSLASGVLEAQTLKNLQNQLTLDITNLSNLSEQYGNKIQEVGGKRDDIAAHQQNLTYKKSIVEDQKVERQQILVATKNKESIFQQQVADLTKQQKQIASEVESLDAVLRTKIDPSTLPPLGHGVLAIPVQGDDLNDVTQEYGSTDFAKNGYQGHWHNGVDLAASIGTPVLAAEGGTIVATGNQDSYCYRGAYGKFIVVKHNNNLVSLYGHLSKQIVSRGDIIKRGQVIGYSGKTGYATGPHLHFTIFAAPTFYMGPSRTCGPMPYGGDLNPLGYL